MNVWKHISINLGVQNLALHFFQIMIEKIAKTPYYITTKVYQLVSWFLSPIFPLLYVLKVEDGE
jgi:hypothetical protein